MSKTFNSMAPIFAEGAMAIGQALEQRRREAPARAARAFEAKKADYNWRFSRANTYAYDMACAYHALLVRAYWKCQEYRALRWNYHEAEARKAHFDKLKAAGPKQHNKAELEAAIEAVVPLVKGLTALMTCFHDRSDSFMKTQQRDRSPVDIAARARMVRQWAAHVGADKMSPRKDVEPPAITVEDNGDYHLRLWSYRIVRRMVTPDASRFQAGQVSSNPEGLSLPAYFVMEYIRDASNVLEWLYEHGDNDAADPLEKAKAALLAIYDDKRSFTVENSEELRLSGSRRLNVLSACRELSSLNSVKTLLNHPHFTGPVPVPRFSDDFFDKPEVARNMPRRRDYETCRKKGEYPEGY